MRTIGSSHLKLRDNPSVDSGQRLRQVFCNQAGPERKCGLRMKPRRRTTGLEARHALGEKAGPDPGQHVACACGGEPGGRIVQNAAATIRRGNNRVRTF